ncbi:Gfo/Idh/MocA family protein [Jeotgalibacillus haloalkalitolerans]|uniref:Gfo/Idh/MocA family oxidoreductase n=1 Tax=Jeotgalibacillus haloalkalitolerans TaxID=3104292 RepID=A0ABU5KQI2_9BACL|nr:Gfo/Idh/MocA family oxidoreductase [Jeotgalibacillus sp. HH7-29]MDZ5713513.1 Gfo/Idh/MocA family oxidoreductase [Jeotgalibacillus sp. HH7-29]
MKELSIGIIGLGAIGQRLIPAFEQHEGFTVSAISDVNKALMKEATQKHSLKAIHYTDAEEMIEYGALDAIYIAVPPKFHHHYARLAAKRGIAILCEKPLANSIAEAEEMTEAVKAANVINAIHFPLHYSNEVALLKEKLSKIGDIQRIELTMRFETWPRTWQQNDWIAKREQGGFIREITPHFIQLTNRLFGKIIISAKDTQYPDNEIDCETSVVAFGSAGHIPFIINGHSGIGMKDDLTYRIYGTKGILSLDQWAELKYGNADQPIELIQERSASASGSLLTAFHYAITTGERADLVPFEEGTAVQKVFEQLL